MNISPDQIRWVLIRVFVLIISVALHEFGHAIMATWLGDDTPRRQGRVTLNPIAHMDPIGTLLLPIAGGIFAAAGGGVGGFGWGKPVQWQPSRVNRKWKMATAQILVAVAGPAMNVLLGTLIALVTTILTWKGVLSPRGEMYDILYFASLTNFVLFFFNLVPAPPLDGGWVAEGLMPYKYKSTFEEYARYGPFVVLAVALISPLNKIFLIPAQFCTEHVYSVFGSLFG